MPLNVTNFVHKGALLHEDVGQFADLLTGVMTDQPVDISNVVTVSTRVVVGDVSQNVSIYPDNMWSTYDYTIRSGTGTDVRIRAGGSYIWRFSGTDGSIQANADNTQDIGLNGLSRPRTIYVGTTVVLGRDPTAPLEAATKQYVDSKGVAWPLRAPDGSNAAPSYSFSSSTSSGLWWEGGGANTLHANAPIFEIDASNLILLSATTAVRLNGTWQIPSAGHLLAIADNTYNIGAAAANRPRTIYAATSFIGPGAVPTGGTAGQVLSKSSATDYALAWITTGVTWPLLAPDSTSAAPQYSFVSNSGTGIFSNGGITVGIATGGVQRALFGGTITFYSGLQFSADNTLDIGATGANRPRNIYVKGGLIAQANAVDLNVGTQAGTYILAGNTGSLIFGIGGQPKWYFDVTSFGFMASVDNAQDIGNTSTNRPRDINVGRNLLVSGQTWLGSSTLSVGAFPLVVQPTATWSGWSGQVNQWMAIFNGTFSSAATNQISVLSLSMATQAATYTTGYAYGLQVNVPSKGAGHTITNLYGVYVGNQGSAGVTSAWGMLIEAQTGASTNNLSLQVNGDTLLNKTYLRTYNTWIGMAPGNANYLLIQNDLPNSTIIQGAAGPIMVSNAKYDGSTWNRYNTGSPVAEVAVGAGNGVVFYSAPAGANPIAAFQQLLYVVSNNAGGGTHMAIGGASSTALVRNPVNSPLSLAVESGDQYLMLSSKSGTHVNGNCYWDGSNWYRFDTATAACAWIATNGSIIYYAAQAGSGAISWGQKASIDNNGYLTVQGGLNVAGGFVGFPSGSIARDALSSAARSRLLGQYQSSPGFSSTTLNTWLATPVSFNITVGGTDSGIVMVNVSVPVTGSVVGTTVYGAITINGGVGLYQMVHIPNAGYATCLSITEYFALSAGQTYSVTLYLQGNAGTWGISVSSHTFMTAVQLTG